MTWSTTKWKKSERTCRLFAPRVVMLSPLLRQTKETCFLPSLVCAVSYTSQYGEKLYFRKFFKFQVRFVCVPSLARASEVTCELGEGLRNVTCLRQSEGIPALHFLFSSCFSAVTVAFKAVSTTSRFPFGLNGHWFWLNRHAAFSLQSILNQVLKPLDVKTKFYNAEVSVGRSYLSCTVSLLVCLHHASFPIKYS